jgi:L-2-hydroxycarboxylate dehydrogenase (NAD+)
MTQTFAYETLYSFVNEVFIQMGCSEKDAAITAQNLLIADLRGVDSHGIARLSGYVRLWEAGRINTKPNITVVHETPSTAVVDGDGGLGMVVSDFAMKIAIEKAKNVGTGWVSVRNSNHYGIAGQYAMQALEHDQIGWAMTNASPLVAPTFATERLLGTNPIAVAIPAHQQPAFVADFATTTAANGKLEILQRKNEDAPLGWMQAADGSASTDANTVKNGGALLPLGSDRTHGSHKGYALGAIVDILSAVLSGANYGPWVPPFVSFLPLHPQPVGAGLGHFFGAMRVDAFRPAQEFKEHMDNWITTFRQAKTVNSEEKVLIHGDIEREMHVERLQKGIPLLAPVVKDIEILAQKFGVAMPASF